MPDASFDVISTFHVIHDIPPANRQDIVKTLAQKLKSGGYFFIKEPVKESHGMPVEEIQALFTEAGLQEIEYKNTKSEYTGKARKPV